RVLANFPHPPRVAHRYDDYDVAISMVSGGLGVALLPSFALQGVLPEGVEAAAVPGVGTRRLIARHRVTRTEPRQAVMTVLEEAIQAGAARDLSTAGAPTPPEPAG